MGFSIPQLFANSASANPVLPVQYGGPAAQPAPSEAQAPTPVPSRVLGRVPTPSCELRLPLDTEAGIRGRQQCIGQMRGAGKSPAEIESAYRAELAGLDNLATRAAAGNASAHDELMSIYARDYALMPPSAEWDAFARRRQQDYTRRLDRYVGSLMNTDTRQYASGGDAEIAFNWAVGRQLAQRQPSWPRTPDDARTMAWLANASNGVVGGFAHDPRLVPWLSALHANPNTNSPSVRAAWESLPGVVASRFDENYAATRAALPARERAGFDSAVRARLDADLAAATRPENRERWPDAEARIRARLALVPARRP